MIDTKKIRIVIHPHPALRKASERVTEINDDIKAIAARMIVLVKQMKGAGLAANQVGLPHAMFVTILDEEDEVYINPFLETSGPIEYLEEGCLSLPGKRVMVPRPKRAKITYQNLEGQTITKESDELLGRCWQHECEHLAGKMITDHQSSTMGGMRRIRQ